jgi:hypothetical protein
MHVFLELLSNHGNKKPCVVLLGHKIQQLSQTAGSIQIVQTSGRTY